MIPNKKSKRRNNAPNVAPQQPHYPQNIDSQQTQYDPSQQVGYDPAAFVASVQSALNQSNEALNVSVLRRYEPDVCSIISTAPYAVLYVFVQQSQTWEKSGVEGTLFVAACTPDSQGTERFRVIILNRRGIDNFSSEINSPDDVDITEEYIIIKGDIGEAEHDPDYAEEGPQIYGLWVFSEPPPSSTAHMREYTGQVIVQCADRAAESKRMIGEHETARLAQELAQTHTSPDVAQEPSGNSRQLSLLELFGQNRAQDSGFSIRNHQSTTSHMIPAAPAPAPVATLQAQNSTSSMFGTNPDTEFFRTATTPNNSGLA